ncbi:hypothetical protein AAVH_23239 [Aphelenchoides avenae]|nr:hypothetical protein AAVH_23239 [Aphelenchus avenae]
MERTRNKNPANGFVVTESPVADLFVFENAKAAKKLEVFKWTVEQTKNAVRASLHYSYTFLLKVADM